MDTDTSQREHSKRFLPMPDAVLGPMDTAVENTRQKSLPSKSSFWPMLNMPVPPYSYFTIT